MDDQFDKWEALLRGQILSTTTNKFFNYIRLIDQKAQALIFLNTILIPFTLNWFIEGPFYAASLLSLATSILSILTAIFCIYPKRRAGKKPDGTFNLLHSGDIAQMTEKEYLTEFMPVFNDSSALAETAVKDMHDTARRIIKPKFKWLKTSYIIFFLGNITAILLLLITF